MNWMKCPKVASGVHRQTRAPKILTFLTSVSLSQNITESTMFQRLNPAMGAQRRQCMRLTACLDPTPTLYGLSKILTECLYSTYHTFGRKMPGTEKLERWRSSREWHVARGAAYGAVATSPNGAEPTPNTALKVAAKVLPESAGLCVPRTMPLLRQNPTKADPHPGRHAEQDSQLIQARKICEQLLPAGNHNSCVLGLLSNIFNGIECFQTALGEFDAVAIEEGLQN